MDTHNENTAQNNIFLIRFYKLEIDLVENFEIF